MKRKLLLLAVALGLCCVSWTTSEAACYPACDTYCPGKTSTTVCGCPSWTDRPCQKTTCGSWNSVGACWYE